MEYQSSGQLGLKNKLNIPSNVKTVYCLLTSVNYSSITSITNAKIDTIAGLVENKQISIYVYSRNNLFTETDTVTVSWLLAYN